jgi:phosphoinositide-3-kinase regulatory subunit 4
VLNSETSMRAMLSGPSDAMSGLPNYVITAGTDRCIRYWDLTNVSKSFVISGPSHSSASPAQLPVYSTLTAGPTTYFIETPPPTLLSSLASTHASPASSLSSSTLSSTSSGASSSSSSGGSASAESPRVVLSSGKQRPPPIHHNDAITDIEALELPTRLLISGSRDGVIKVWK